LFEASENLAGKGGIANATDRPALSAAEGDGVQVENG